MTVLLLAVGIVLCLTVFFKTAEITVSGDDIYNPEQIIEASGITLGENMVLISKKDVAQTIEKSLPYIEKAEITRSLSCRVNIKVTAATAVAALESGESYILLNASGKVLEDGVVALADDVLVLKAGEIVSAVPGERVTFADANAVSDFASVYALLKDGEITGLTQLDVQNRLQIKAVYQNRIVLTLGEVSSIAGKADFVKATLERSEQNNPSFRGTIDFSIDKKAFQNAEEETKAPTASETPLQPDGDENANSKDTADAA